MAIICHCGRVAKSDGSRHLKTTNELKKHFRCAAGHLTSRYYDAETGERKEDESPRKRGVNSLHLRCPECDCLSRVISGEYLTGTGESKRRYQCDNGHRFNRYFDPNTGIQAADQGPRKRGVKLVIED